MSAPSTFEVVVYRDSGDDVQVWAGPLSDWAPHAREYRIEEDDVEDHLTILGQILPTADLPWPASSLRDVMRGIE